MWGTTFFFYYQNHSEAANKCSHLHFNKELNLLSLAINKRNVEVSVVISMLCFCNVFDATVKLPISEIRVLFIYCHHCPIALPDRAAPEAVRTGFCRKEIKWLETGNREGSRVTLSKQKHLQKSQRCFSFGDLTGLSGYFNSLLVD